MSLRNIHIVFIVVSILLTLFTTFWGITTFQSAPGATGHRLFAIGSLCVALGMSVYAVRFIKKTRELGIR